MSVIACSVPSLLKDCTEGQTRFDLEAETLAGALTALTLRYPLLRLHLYDEQNILRPHVLIYLNDQNVAWFAPGDVPLTSGDRLSVLQNVSGG